MTKHSAPLSAPIAELFPWPTRAVCALIFCATLLAYAPALSADFIWDDQPGHVTKPELRSLDGLGRIWFEVGATQQYYPLLHTAFWLEHRLWGDAPFGYHLVNILLHATAACLAGVVLRRLAVPGAWLAAFLFALHPVAVESVAWVSEQKNTLSTVFYFAAALAYLRYDRQRGTAAYYFATGLFAAALLTKSVTATLPAALLVVFWWQRGRLRWRHDVVPLLPWFALGLSAGALTAWIESSLIGAQGDDFALSALARCLLAGRILWFYVGSLLWPVNLCFIYPRWTIDTAVPWQYAGLIAALAILAALWWWRRRRRGPLAAALFFAGTLFPALGFVDVFPFVYSFVADHFQYVARLGVLAGIAAGGTMLLSRAPRWLGLATASAVLAVLAALTWTHSGIYRDLFTLYETTLRRNPDCWMAHNNLGIALVDAGRAAEAIPHYERALRLRPGYAEAANNLGYALTALRRPAEAIPRLQRALQLKPGNAEAHNNLGRALMALGRADEGQAAFAEAVRLKPDYALARVNLGLALANARRPAEALPHFQRAAQLDPGYADAELNWGIALTVSGKVVEALPHFERAVRLSPTVPLMHHSLGRALATAGRYDESIARFRSALSLNPSYGDAHFQLALALRQLGRMDEARQHYEAAERLGAVPR